MSNGQNNVNDTPGQGGWRERIHNLSEIEGEPPPDMDRIWKKLEARLAADPFFKKKKIYPYRLIAASLLAAVLTYGYFQFGETKRQVIVQKPSTVKSPVQQVILTGRTTGTMGEKIPSPILVQQAPVEIKPVRTRKDMAVIKRETTPVQQYLPLPDSTRYTAIMRSLQPVLNKMVVNPDDREPIHLNEIKFGAPVTPVAGNNIRRPFTIQLRDQQATIMTEPGGPVNTIHSLREN